MKKYFDILSNCPLFNSITDEDLSAILECIGAKVLTVDKSATIFSEGEKIDKIGIVLSGSLKIERTDYYGNRSIVTSILPGEIFGEAFACAESQKIPFDIVADEKCKVMLVDCQRVIHACSNACDFHNRLIFNLLKIVSLKNIYLNQKAEITSKRSTREKLMTYLMVEAKKSNGNEFYIPYDRQELADFLEVDRSGLSNEISKLRSEGIIESKRCWFKLY
ncbi:MAG: Crp/Fnr family transcriptional regulator [Clostridia bacterium]|nr:Crp/Fnr family transcriptional regulator [Clostridia bacterium]